MRSAWIVAGLLACCLACRGGEDGPARAAAPGVTSGERELPPARHMDGERLEIRGRLRLVGSARYAEYVVTPPDNYDVSLGLDRIKSSGLAEHAGRFVRAKGRMRVQPMYAPGRKFVHWRYTMEIDELRLEE